MLPVVISYQYARHACASKLYIGHIYTVQREIAKKRLAIAVNRSLRISIGMKETHLERLMKPNTASEVTAKSALSFVVSQ